MTVGTYTKNGTKAVAPAKLDKAIFGVEAKNHELLKTAYLTYLANARHAGAQTKARGEVRGGGKKPWRQKGTGRARFGSSRNPIWRGGGVAFGPTGKENHHLNLTVNAKRTALRQALSLAAEAGKIKVIETFDCKEGKVAPTVSLLNKIEASGNTLIVVSLKDALVKRATGNIPSVKAVDARYLTVFDLLNADTIVMSQKSLDIITGWLTAPSKKTLTKEMSNE